MITSKKPIALLSMLALSTFLLLPILFCQEELPFWPDAKTTANSAHLLKSGSDLLGKSFLLVPYNIPTCKFVISFQDHSLTQSSAIDPQEFPIVYDSRFGFKFSNLKSKPNLAQQTNQSKAADMEVYFTFGISKDGPNELRLYRLTVSDNEIVEEREVGLVRQLDDVGTQELTNHLLNNSLEASNLRYAIFRCTLHAFEDPNLRSSADIVIRHRFLEKSQLDWHTRSANGSETASGLPSDRPSRTKQPTPKMT